jgi:hypothetical protein
VSASSPTPSRDPDPPARGLRADIRRALYISSKYELGCPTEAQCALYERSQEAACLPCPKHLKPVERDPNTVALRRIRLLLWLESLITAGCHFGPDDLSVALWEGLADLKNERARFERLIFDQKHQKNQADVVQTKALREARKLDKIPEPGQSIFGGGKKR